MTTKHSIKVNPEAFFVYRNGSPFDQLAMLPTFDLTTPGYRAQRRTGVSALRLHRECNHQQKQWFDVQMRST
jgi:hypothetical protein